MDPVTAAVLDQGRKNTRLLVQPQYSPMPVERQIAILYCGTHGLLRDVRIDQVHDFEDELFRQLELAGVFDKLAKGQLDDTVSKAIEEAAARVTVTLKSKA